MLNNFIKTYSDKTYKYTTMVRHKGIVIAFAMDDQRRVFYSVLDLSGSSGTDSVDKTKAPSPLDVYAWPAGPEELIFPNEIAEVGFGVADQTKLPTPLTTAQLTADAPFQVLSDGSHVYVFRQAIARDHADILYKRDKGGNEIKDKEGKSVPLVDATLLVDRFVLVGTNLQAKLEVRYQRSRSKTRPANRKDSLDAKDLDGNFFYEPTQELKFVGRLTGGRFTVLLLPTAVAEVQRWQIFAQNSRTGLMDSFNVERSADGLFNTRGSQSPSIEGYAESALKFGSAGAHVSLTKDPKLGPAFTLEAWLYPTRPEEQRTEPQALIVSDSTGEEAGTSIRIEALTRLRVDFGDKQVCQSKSILTPDQWNHVAITCDGAAIRFYIAGRLRDKVELPGNPFIKAGPIRSFGAAKDSFSGTIDEIRLWKRARGMNELRAEMHQRLTGLEPGLTGYWRFDEAAGDTVYDQTIKKANGTIYSATWTTSDAPMGESSGVNRDSFSFDGRTIESGPTALLYYQQSNAASGYDGQQKPLKQSGRVMLAVSTHGDFKITAKSLEGLKKESVPDDLLEKLGKLKDQLIATEEEFLARVIEVIGAAQTDQFKALLLKHARETEIAALDFGVSAAGRIAQVPDSIKLGVIKPDQANEKSINEQLDEISDLKDEDEAQRLQEERLAWLKRGAEVSMPLVHTDPFGLTISGALLGFAWTKDTPLLFDSAVGNLALYFRGVNDQFFVAYYTTLTERAKYSLKDKEEKESVVCFARSTESEMDKITIQIGDASQENACSVTITGAGIEETWNEVPRDPKKFAAVLNGLAGDREYIGSGTIEVKWEGISQTIELSLPDGVRRSLETGAILTVGETKVKVLEKVENISQKISISIEPVIKSDVLNLPVEKLPVFFQEYDYDIFARTTKIPGDLSDGSLLIRAVQSKDAKGAVINQSVTSGQTLTSKWTAAAPGCTLAFDGARSHLTLADGIKLTQLDAPADLTLEAWMRPTGSNGTACVMQHSSGTSSYKLGLQPPAALAFDGDHDYVEIITPNSSLDFSDNEDSRFDFNFDFDKDFTVEAWVKAAREQKDLKLGDNDIIGKWQGDGGYPFVIRYIPSSGKILAGRYDTVARAEINSQTRFDDEVFHHIAFVKVGKRKQLSLYVDGLLDGEIEDTTSRTIKNDSPIYVGRRGSDTNRFKGAVGEVRIWRRARTQQEIADNMRRRLNGDESDLAGYWRFEDGRVNNLALNGGEIYGNIYGAPKQESLPLPYYTINANVNGLSQQTRQFISGDDWTHMAAVFDQSYGIRFDGSGSYLDSGNDVTLDISRDLTIEVFLKLNDLNSEHCLLSRGRFDDKNQDQDVPYALYVGKEGKLRFAFENVAQQTKSYQSNTSLTKDLSYKIAVTRKRKKIEESQEKEIEIGGQKIKTTVVKVTAWDEISFYINGKAAGSDKYESEQSNDDKFRQPIDIGNSNLPLEIGRGFRGVISEMRIWNEARDAAHIAAEIRGNEKGLVSWWRFEEGQGNKAFDANSNNHAAFNGSLRWVKDPDPKGSSLTLYLNGKREETKRLSQSGTIENQFTLGALIVTSKLAEQFQGEMEEVRIWKTSRTEEQIQDNLFRRLLGENATVIEEELIAYYTFEPKTDDQSQLNDNSLLRNHLTVKDASFVLSTAPIGDDTPQVRSALAGVKTTFNGLIHSTPAVQEYGDLQYDSQGNLIGIFKRCYSYVENGQWKLITGYKVGDLVTEWIGQAQFAPQLIGYIEGAPPVPSENLFATGYVLGEFADYTGASSVELTKADSTTYTYATSKDKGFDIEAEFKLGWIIGTEASAGFGLVVKTVDVENVVGAHGKFENSQGWLEDASTGVGLTTTSTTKMELRGSVENVDAIAYPQVGRRFVPDNMGMALVKSETADVFALRLKHNQALVSFQMRPNPDIPPDWNIITFPINPRYTKQGTLDGKIGFVTDPNYPNALTYSPDTSYFKPIEAYALKNRIDREEAELRNYFEQYEAGAKGRREESRHFSSGDLATGRALEKLPHLHKRNIANTYVWTADGGLFAETEEMMDVHQEMIGGSFSFKGMGGIYTDLTLALGGTGFKFELDALAGGHLNLTVTKTQESQTAFGLNVDLGKVESDTYLRDEKGNLVMDTSDPRDVKPKRMPGRVDAYRFMTFYLEPKSDHYDLFFNRVVDPEWLNQSDHPNAVALREARQPGKNPACWRIMHRVTYVSRVLPTFEENAAPSLEKALQTLDIDSNYELIKQLEPYVSNALTNFSTFAQSVSDAINTYLPELQPHTEEIIQYLSLYLGLVDLRDAGDEAISLLERAPNQPPLVNAGLDQTIGLDGSKVEVTVEGIVIDDRLEKAEAIFVTWEKVTGDGEVTFADRHALKTQATFTKRGRYGLRLTASDGKLSSSDETTLVVNERPVITAGVDQQINTLEAKLTGIIIDNGLADPQAGRVTVKWSQAGFATAENRVEFVEGDNVLQPKVVFKKRGHYLLKLTVDNGTFQTDDEILVTVAARATDGLQAFYTFEENKNGSVLDVSGAKTPLNLVIKDTGKVAWVTGGLALKSPTLLAATGSTHQLIEAIQATNEITIEAWIKPAPAVTNGQGLARIVTLSNGPAARNFTLGQFGKSFHAHLRTTTTNANASNQALACEVPQSDLTHLVCTRDKNGLTVLYVNGQEVSRRTVSGDFSAWSSDFQLGLGGEFESSDGHGRAWQGEFHLVAIYRRALSEAEVKLNFEFGADANLPPILTAGPDQIVKWQDTSGSCTTQLQGRVTHDRETPNGNITWAQISGPPNGVTFSNDKDPATTATFQEKGRYLLRLTADDGELMTSDEVVVIVNQPPAVEITRQHSLAMPEGAVALQLSGKLTDTGLGDASAAPGNLSYQWEQVGGSVSVMIEPVNQLSPTVRFNRRGVYELKLTISNGYCQNIIPVTITVNERPLVTAGQPQVITWPDKRLEQLAGIVTDTGLGAPGGTLNLQWIQVSGPGGGNATFTAENQKDSSVEFSASGVYVLRLTATNDIHRELTASADVTITVNEKPAVAVGPAPLAPILLPDQAILDATVSDDGLPESPGVVRLEWSKVEGPGTVTFNPPDTDYTTARFSEKGVYTLRLTAYDGAASDSDEVKFVVHAAPRIEAGTEQRVPPGAVAKLSVNILDDGLGDPQQGKISVKWTQSNGPATAIIDAPTSSAPTSFITNVTLPEHGVYQFQLEASNGFLSSSGTAQVIATKHEVGLQALYTFDETAGTIAHDVADSAEPLDIAINDPAAVSWTANGLTVHAPAILTADLPLRRITEAVKMTRAITIEAWVTPQNITQGGAYNRPALILTLAHRWGDDLNFSLEQLADQYGVRVRGSEQMDDQRIDKIHQGQTRQGTVTPTLTQIVFTLNTSGEAYIFVNGKAQWRGEIADDLSSWNEYFQLGLANKIGGDPGLAWLGDFHLIGLYNRAFSADEIKEKYNQIKKQEKVETNKSAKARQAKTGIGK